MEIHQIKYFVALCDMLNFTRAAERSNVTQPSLTRAIKLLEEELGGPLFHRERANTHLTELGRLMRPHLEQVLAEIETAKGRAHNVRKLQHSTLTLGIMCTIGPTKLLDLIASYRRKHPEVHLLLRDAKGQALQEMLLKGELEAAVFALPEGVDERLHMLPLFDDRFGFAFPPGHRYESCGELHCEDLQGENYVSRANCEFHDFAARVFSEKGVDATLAYLSEREDWCLAMIMAGLGVGFTPEHTITLPGLLWRPLDEPGFVRTVSVGTVRGRPHSPAVGAFVREAIAWRTRGCPDGLTRAA